jgi:hypothetical protein
MAEITITGWTTHDIRFPTSLDKTGSDAMNAAGDYSAAYCILETDSKYSGHGMVSYPSPLLCIGTLFPKQSLTFATDLHDWPWE